MALISLHFGTQTRCFAAEIQKTVELQDPQPTVPESGHFPRALLALDSKNGPQYALLVDKKTRTLTVWQNDGDKIKPIAEFAVDLGAREGNKTIEGDRKTPEGIYFFQKSLDGHKLDFDNYGEHVFTTDYPNFFDRLEKKTGKGIWLHAIPDDKSLQRGSHGCVVVRNKVIEELGKFIEVQRTPLVVVEQVDYLSKKEWSDLRARWLTWAREWAATRDQDQNEIQIFSEGPKFVLRIGSKILYAVRTDDGLNVLSGHGT